MGLPVDYIMQRARGRLIFVMFSFLFFSFAKMLNECMGWIFFKMLKKNKYIKNFSFLKLIKRVKEAGRPEGFPYRDSLAEKCHFPCRKSTKKNQN